MRCKTTLLTVLAIALAASGAAPQKTPAASISVGSYPTAVSPGQQIEIRWTVSGPGKVKYNAVQWGSSPSCMMSCTASTLDKPYSTSFAAASEGDIYFRVQTGTSLGYFRGEICKISVGSSGSSGRRPTVSIRNPGRRNRNSAFSGRRSQETSRSNRNTNRRVPSSSPRRIRSSANSPLSGDIELASIEYGTAVKADLKDWRKGKVNLGAEIGVELDAVRLDGRVLLGDPEALSARATGSVKLGAIAGKAGGNLSVSNQGVDVSAELKGEMMIAKAEGEAALAWMIPKFLPWIGGATIEIGAEAHVGAGVEGKVGGKAKFDSSGVQLKCGAAAAVGVGGGADLFFNVKFPTGDEMTIWIHLDQDANGEIQTTQLLLIA